MKIRQMLYILLDDGREIGAPLDHYRWLARATPEQRAVEPHIGCRFALEAEVGGGEGEHACVLSGYNHVL